MGSLRALGSGLSGALTVTLLNETVRQIVPHAPRLDVLGMRATARLLRAMGQEPPEGMRLRGLAMVGDLIANTIYYAPVAGGGSWWRGALLGLAAGVGAATLPRPLGLGRQPDEEAPITHLLTVAWYLAGGLAAAAVARLAANNK